MTAWPRHPVIYEISTWVWLGDLGRKYRKAVDLATVPEQEWDAVASHGFDAVWFMGVWERSPAGIDISMRNPGLLEDFRRALPDFSAEDNVGSPCCVRRYVVDGHLGGPKGLADNRHSIQSGRVVHGRAQRDVVARRSPRVPVLHPRCYGELESLRHHGETAYSRGCNASVKPQRHAGRGYAWGILFGRTRKC